MNERIKELAEHTNAWYPTGYPSAEGGDEEWQNLVIFKKEDFEKFAELIVLECSAFVYNYPEKYLTRNQAREICLGMEKVFGVE
jgi:hypothetical protein